MPEENKKEITVVSVTQAKAHLDEVKAFVLSAKFNGKTGYNPYQWLHDRNVTALESVLDSGKPSKEELAAIMALPKTEEPVIKQVKTKRIDEFFNEQQAKRRADKAAKAE